MPTYRTAVWILCGWFFFFLLPKPLLRRQASLTHFSEPGRWAMRSKCRGCVKALDWSRGHCVVSPGKHRPHPRTPSFWLQVPRPGHRPRAPQSQSAPLRPAGIPVFGLWRGARVSVAGLVAQLCLTLCDPMDLSPPGSSAHRDSPGKNTGVGCHALLQGTFPTQGSNPGLPHCRQILYCLSQCGGCYIFGNISCVFTVERAQGRPEGKHVFSHLGLSPASVSEIITGCFNATLSVPHLMREVKRMLWKHTTDTHSTQVPPSRPLEMPSCAQSLMLALTLDWIWWVPTPGPASSSIPLSVQPATIYTLYSSSNCLNFWFSMGA